MKTKEEKIASENKKAYHNYFIEDKLEVGISLLGSEVKSIREGKISLSEAYAGFEKDELYIFNMYIAPFKYGGLFNHKPLRKRKLLLTKQELKKLYSKVAQRGYTLIPLKLYFKGSYVKLTIALAKGKRKYDKREAIKKRELERQLRVHSY